MIHNHVTINAIVPGIDFCQLHHAHTSFIRYGFSAQDAVAVLGAHALGRATPQDQGYSGSWVVCSNVLTNKYYISMSNATLGWAQKVGLCS